MGAEERGVMMATIVAAGALGLLELSLGRFEIVDRLLGPLGARLEAGGVREPGSVRFVPDQIEALIALDRLEEAERLLAVLERQGTQLERASALAAAGRCRGLLAAAGGDLDGALASLQEALREHERVSMPFERARTLLALGATRRRARMKRPARETLEEALATFDELGARLWAEKARAELARIGGRPAATGELTETERPHRRPRGGGALEQGDRGGPVRHTEDGRHPALADLPQGRCPLPHRARQARLQRRPDAQSVGICRLSQAPRRP